MHEIMFRCDKGYMVYLHILCTISKAEMLDISKISKEYA